MRTITKEIKLYYLEELPTATAKRNALNQKYIPPELITKVNQVCDKLTEVFCDNKVDKWHQVSSQIEGFYNVTINIQTTEDAIKNTKDEYLKKQYDTHVKYENSSNPALQGWFNSDKVEYLDNIYDNITRVINIYPFGQTKSRFNLNLHRYNTYKQSKNECVFHELQKLIDENRDKWLDGFGRLEYDEDGTLYLDC